MLLDVVNSRSTTTTIDVVQAGTASNTHMRIANTKMEIVLCSIIVSPSIPKNEVGNSQSISGMMVAIASLMALDTVLSCVLWFCILGWYLGWES